MDDLTASKTTNTNARIPLGMSSFDETQQRQFGRSLRIAMACIDGTNEPVTERALPQDVPSIRQRLKALSQDITSQHADLLELLVRFDEAKGWKTSGACHCAAWMNSEIGISPQLGWEYLRAGRTLRILPTTLALFRAGKLTWSKIRLITRVATADNEKILCHAALDASVTQIKRLCAGYRWKEDDEGKSENERALRQWESRSLRWHETSNGSTSIQLILPPEMAQAFLNSVEHSLRQLEGSEHTMSQRRADAALLMAETSLQSAGQEFTSADRYQVVVSVEASELSTSKFVNSETNKTGTPTKRPTVKGAGPIARETARRIACDCSVTVNTLSNGEPINIGRKSRIWPAAMARAIKDRDQHCQFPGCDHTQNLQIHHIKHWADNGETSIQNGVCICSFHHTLLHEGGYTIQRTVNHEQHLIDKGSFDILRKLSPTRYRFSVIDANGQDIRERHTINIEHDQALQSPLHSTRVECNPSHSDNYRYPKKEYNATPEKCAEPASSYYHHAITRITPPTVQARPHQFQIPSVHVRERLHRQYRFEQALQ